MIWYNENNIEMKTDSITAKDRRYIIIYVFTKKCIFIYSFFFP